MKHKLFTSLLTLSVITASSMPALANTQTNFLENSKNQIISQSSENSRMDKDVTKSLTTTSFTQIFTTNNWVNADVTVTLKSDSAVKNVIVYATSAKGTVLSETPLSAGSSATFYVGAFDGDYTISAKAVGSSGEATFNIKDKLARTNN
ncbi:MAG: hypothetical protein FWC34_00015 [Bacteroidetes bacterium]|nr:hypothetical protein [Bacteroidota bacterium]